MKPNTRWPLLLLLFLASPLLTNHRALAETREAPPNQTHVTIDFLPYRVPSLVSCQANRDLNFLWSSNYQTMFGVTPAVMESDLAQFGINLAETFKNPFNFPMNDIQLIHDYQGLRQTFRDSVYQVCPAPNGFRVNQAGYPDAERNHIDTYLYVPPYPPSYAGDDPSGYGRWTATSFFTADPDEDPGSPEMSMNSISVSGGKPNEIGVPGANAWYRADGPSNSMWDHEFLHALNAASGFDRSSEMYSSISQVLAGASNTPNPYDVPYTWSLLSYGGPSVNNYFAWESFGAYLVFGFRGTDTTFAGRSDDLLWRWTMAAGSSSPDLTKLGEQLVDSRCPECTAKFPAGVTSAKDRREALIHNWRVFNYVDNPTLAQGQYGIPPNFGPSPSRRLGYWKDNDGCCWDNTIALPPETTLTSATPKVVVTSSRTVTCPTEPPGCTGHSPLAVTALDDYGAEYWIVRSDASLNQAGNNLVVRVEPTSLPLQGGGDRLMVSVVGYSNTSDNGVRTALWTKPQWAQTVVGPQWIDVRTLPCGAVELTLPNFGSTNKAALVVVTLGSSSTSAGGNSLAVQPFKLTMSVQQGPPPCTPPAPTALMTSPTVSDERGAFSPSGTEVVFTHYTPGAGDSRIYRKPLSGSATQLVPGTPAGPQLDPDWSPRGDLVVYEQDTAPGGDTHLWLYNVQTGGSPVQLTNSTRYEAFPAFSPNGQEVAYMHGIGYGSSTWELRRVKVDGTSNVLVYACNYSMSWPRWSLDGSRIYFVRGDSLYAVNSSGGQPVFIPKVVPSVQDFDLPLGTGPILTDKVLCSAPHVALQDTTAQTITYPFEQSGRPTRNARWAFDGIRALYSIVQPSGDTELYYGATSCNHAPVLSATSKVDIEDLPLCVIYTRYLSATDADGDPITYKAAYLPPGASFTANRFRWRPTQGQALMTFYVVFRAIDNKGGADNVVVKLTTGDECFIDCPNPPYCFPVNQEQVAVEDLPAVFALRQSAPNPFVDRATIGFDLPEASHVTLSIFDLQGRLVRRLADRQYSAGRWSVAWDRTDDSGRRVTHGVYFYRAQLGTFVSEKKMLLLR